MRSDDGPLREYRNRLSAQANWSAVMTVNRLPSGVTLTACSWRCSRRAGHRGAKDRCASYCQRCTRRPMRPMRWPRLQLQSARVRLPQPKRRSWRGLSKLTSRRSRRVSSTGASASSRPKAMRRELERRLRRLELASSGPAKIAIWITLEDGTLRSPNGEHLTEEAFLCRYPESSRVFIVSASDWEL